MQRLILGVAAMMFACTMVFAGGKSADKKEKSTPSVQDIQKISTVTLKAEVRDGEVHLSWSPANDDTSDGVKVVASDSNPSPMYPQDGYVVWLSGSGHAEAVVSNEKATSPKARYYRVCFVSKGDHAISVAVSNVVEIPAIEVTAATKAMIKEKAEKKAAEKAEKDAKKAAEKAEKAAKKAAEKAEKEAKKATEKSAKDASSKSKKSSAVNVCPDCGWKGDAEAVFCKKCGSRMTVGSNATDK